MSSWANAESSDEDEPHVSAPASSGETAVAAQLENMAVSEEPQSQHGHDRESNLSIRVGNLSYGTTEEQLGDFFVDGGCKVKSVRIPLSETGRSRGFGFVEFEDIASVELALTANNEVIDKRNIVVEKKISRPPADRRERDNRGPRRDDHRRGGEQRNERGDRPERRPRPEGDGRNRENPRHYRDADTSADWTKGEHVPARDREHDRERSGRGGGRGGRTREQRAEGNEADATPAVPLSRPKLNLQPRTLPLETKTVPQNSRIFGDGKARENTASGAEIPVNPPAPPIPPAAAAAGDNVASAAVADRQKDSRDERGDHRRGDRGDKGSGTRHRDGGGRADAGRGDGSGRRDRDRSDRQSKPNRPPHDEKDKDDFKEVKDTSRKDKGRDGKKAEASGNAETPAVTASASAPPTAALAAANAQQGKKSNRFSYLVSDDESDN